MNILCGREGCGISQRVGICIGLLLQLCSNKALADYSRTLVHLVVASVHSVEVGHCGGRLGHCLVRQ